jgi:hypothetical protein
MPLARRWQRHLAVFLPGENQTIPRHEPNGAGCDGQVRCNARAERPRDLSGLGDRGIPLDVQSCKGVPRNGMRRSVRSSTTAKLSSLQPGIFS